MIMPAPAQVTLPSDREVRVTRQFDAKRETVYRAHTEPELVKKWMLGPPGWAMPVCEMDVRPGGKYRWRWRSDSDQQEFGFHGTFQEVEKPARLVHDEYYDPGDVGGAMPTGKPAVVTLELTETGGVTTLTCTIQFESKEARDAAVSTGMTDGMEMGYARLDAMFESKAA
jgi:uncharacterized protein YndB with AHSA1/START domain